VAAQLRRLPETQVTLVRGGLGELRVAIDGEDAYDGNRLWYPLPRQIVAAVRRHLGLQLAAG